MDKVASVISNLAKELVAVLRESAGEFEGLTTLGYPDLQCFFSNDEGKRKFNLLRFSYLGQWFIVTEDFGLFLESPDETVDPLLIEDLDLLNLVLEFLDNRRRGMAWERGIVAAAVKKA